MSTSSRLRLTALRAPSILLLLAIARDGHGAPPASHSPDDCIKITSKASLLHLGSLDSFDISKNGTKAATLILDCIDHNKPESARAALAIYEKIIPEENFGGEYTSLQWLCEYLAAPAAEQKAMLADRYAASFYHLLADNDYAVLKEYLRRKYHLEEAPSRDKDDAVQRHRYHEDFLIFNNPRRERWEKSSRVLEALGLKKGDSVADIGCGSGYYTFKIADVVGEKGQVFAIDNNERHLEYVSGLTKKYGIRSVRVVRPTMGNVNLPGDAKIDCAFMCALYHSLYAVASESERAAFIGGIKKHLKPDGTLVVVDNALVTDQSLPYHGLYIAKELVIEQLKHYGFTLTATHQFTPQRYVLVFKMSGPGASSEGKAVCTSTDCIPIKSPISLVQFVGVGAGPGFTKGGREAAKVFYRALDKHDRAAAQEAIALYTDLIPKERFGDEYSAFLWYSEYVLASPEEKKRLQSDRFVADYFQYLGGEEFKTLKKYVWYKYYLDVSDEEVALGPGVAARRIPAEMSQFALNGLGDLIAFNNPRRETWEKTGEVLKFLNLKPGSSVADVGCGSGFYTFKFAELIGKEGRVYAVDTSKEMLEITGATARKFGLNNVNLTLSGLNDTKLPPKCADVVFLCSLYHVVYVTSMEHVKDQFVASIKNALKEGGRLVIADNDVLPDDQVPYYGPRIDRRLTIRQLEHYGLKLVDTAQFIPQRYILVFQVDPRVPSS